MIGHITNHSTYVICEHNSFEKMKSYPFTNSIHNVVMTIFFSLRSIKSFIILNEMIIFFRLSISFAQL